MSSPSTPVRLAWFYLVGGLIGLVMSVTLLVEKIELIKDPDYIPSCSLNPVMACGSVMKSWQAEVFGIPNPVIGIAAFGMVIAAGAALLAGARLARWFWWLFLVGTAFGAVFVTWLAYSSLYDIGMLCPYCMVVWSVTIPMFFLTAAHVLRGFFHDFRWVLVFFWFGLVLALITVRFWSYWSTLI